jgi:hypothetical protein
VHGARDACLSIRHLARGALLSAAHGVWAQVGESDYDASYVALRFDENRDWIGSRKRASGSPSGRIPTNSRA